MEDSEEQCCQPGNKVRAVVRSGAVVQRGGVSGMVGWTKSTTMALQRVASGKDYAPRLGATCAADWITPAVDCMDWKTNTRYAPVPCQDDYS